MLLGFPCPPQTLNILGVETVLSVGSVPAPTLPSAFGALAWHSELSHFQLELEGPWCEDVTMQPGI